MATRTNVFNKMGFTYLADHLPHTPGAELIRGPIQGGLEAWWQGRRSQVPPDVERDTTPSFASGSCSQSSFLPSFRPQASPTVMHLKIRVDSHHSRYALFCGSLELWFPAVVLLLCSYTRHSQKDTQYTQ